MIGRRSLALAVLLAAFALTPSGAHADEVLRLATSQAGWDNSVVPLGKRAGFFREKGIDAEVSFTDGSSAALQALIAGGVDVAVVSVPLFLGAVAKGAPLKMISANFTGGSDLLWYVRADSRIKKLKDAGQDPKKIAIMVASHNEDTVRFAIEKMKEIGISPEDKVICFGQLLGMCDYITMPLGESKEIL